MGKIYNPAEGAAALVAARQAARVAAAYAKAVEAAWNQVVDAGPRTLQAYQERRCLRQPSWAFTRQPVITTPVTASRSGTYSTGLNTRSQPNSQGEKPASRANAKHWTKPNPGFTKLDPGFSSHPPTSLRSG